jgi:hypothetical protein
MCEEGYDSSASSEEGGGPDQEGLCTCHEFQSPDLGCSSLDQGPSCVDLGSRGSDLGCSSSDLGKTCLDLGYRSWIWGY